jgi:hypothetical protein
LCWDRVDLGNASITPVQIIEQIETADAGLGRRPWAALLNAYGRPVQEDAIAPNSSSTSSMKMVWA